MSTMYSGRFWASSQFASSMFRGVGVTLSEGKYWAGSFWKNSLYATNMFACRRVASFTGRYWSGRFWANSQYATTFFAGEPAPVPVPAPVVTSSAAMKRRWIEEQIREVNAEFLAQLDDEDVLLLR